MLVKLSAPHEPWEDLDLFVDHWERQCPFPLGVLSVMSQHSTTRHLDWPSLGQAMARDYNTDLSIYVAMPTHQCSVQWWNHGLYSLFLLSEYSTPLLELSRKDYSLTHLCSSLSDTSVCYVAWHIRAPILTHQCAIFSLTHQCAIFSLTPH